MSTTRQPGFYRVKYKGEWVIAILKYKFNSVDHYFFMIDKAFGFEENEFDEIHPIPVDPEPTAQFHSTDKLLEVAAESWDASERRNEHKHKKYPDAFNYTLSDKTIPTKEQYLSQLKQSLEG